MWTRRLFRTRGESDDAAAVTSAVCGSFADVPGEILWLCGPTAIGKSTVGWAAYQQSRFAGQHTAFLDLDQVGFCRPDSAADPGNHRLKAGNLAAVWRNYHERGTQRLVVVGPLERPEAVQTYLSALPAADFTICRLHASRSGLLERVALNGKGAWPGAWLPGSEWKNLSEDDLHRIGEQAWADAVTLESAGVVDFSVETDGRDAREIAKHILGNAGWL